jgi:hypothetical protein
MSMSVTGVRNPAPDDAAFVHLAKTYAAAHASMSKSAVRVGGVCAACPALKHVPWLLCGLWVPGVTRSTGARRPGCTTHTRAHTHTHTHTHTGCTHSNTRATVLGVPWPAGVQGRHHKRRAVVPRVWWHAGLGACLILCVLCAHDTHGRQCPLATTTPVQPCTTPSLHRHATNPAAAATVAPELRCRRLHGHHARAV